MSYNKIANHRNLIANIPVNKVQDSGGTNYDISSLTTGQFLQKSGNQITSAGVTAITASSTVLSFDTLTDGEFLQRNGTTIRSTPSTVLSGTSIAHGESHTTSSLDNDLTVTVWTKITGSGTVLTNGYAFNKTVDNRLIYSGSTYSNAHSHFLANATLSYSSSVTPNNINFAFAVSNNVQSSSMILNHYPSSSVPEIDQWRNCTLSTILTLTASQFVEIWARANTSTTKLYVPSASFVVVQL